MPFAIGQLNPHLLSATLSSLNVGVWDWEVAGDRMRVDATCAALFGIPAHQAGQDLPLRAATDAIHPEDYPSFRHRITDVVSCGGLFVAEYRTCPSPRDTRWILARGRFETDADGLVVRGRGIVIDITESKRDGHVEEEAVFLSIPDEEELTPLLRATDKAIAAYQELERMGADGDRLRAVARPLLLSLGRELARSALQPQAEPRPDPKDVH